MTTRITLGILLLAVVGCGARRELGVSSLDVTRSSWDSLSVNVVFSATTVLGGSRVVEPEETTVRVFNAAYDTLYSGPSMRVRVDDWLLKDEERVLVEVCGRFSRHYVCGQRGFIASRKRLSVDHAITYPLQDDYDRGRFSFSFLAERQRFDADGWEPLEDVDSLEGVLLTRVDGTEDGGVPVPFETPRGGFDLSTLPNYRDFRYYLSSELHDRDSATIAFEIYVDRFGATEPLAVDSTVVRTKSRQARELEAGFFVEAAARQLFDALRLFPMGQERFVYLNRWNYVAGNKTYDIDMEISWRSTFVRSRFFSVSGTLRVREDGTQPTFTIRNSNDRGRRRWDNRFRRNTVGLATLSSRQGERNPSD